MLRAILGLMVALCLLAGCNPYKRMQANYEALERLTATVQAAKVTEGRDSIVIAPGAVQVLTDTLTEITTSDTLRIERYYYHTRTHTRDSVKTFYDNREKEVAMQARLSLISAEKQAADIVIQNLEKWLRMGGVFALALFAALLLFIYLKLR